MDTIMPTLQRDTSITFVVNASFPSRLPVAGKRLPGPRIDILAVQMRTEQIEELGTHVLTLPLDFENKSFSVIVHFET